MKKVLFTSIIVFASIFSFGQTQTSDHLTFKGVPIDGTLNEFVAKMKQAGFTLIGTEDGIAMLEGEFAGFKGCKLGVVTFKPKNFVSKVAVMFPDRDTWSSLSSDYFSLKEMLTVKYGEPAKESEKFDTSSTPRDDEDKMYAVKFDNCKYHSLFETDKGIIALSIEHQSVISCYNLLEYYDKINGDIIEEKALEDL